MARTAKIGPPRPQRRPCNSCAGSAHWRGLHMHAVTVGRGVLSTLATMIVLGSTGCGKSSPTLLCGGVAETPAGGGYSLGYEYAELGNNQAGVFCAVAGAEQATATLFHDLSDTSDRNDTCGVIFDLDGTGPVGEWKFELLNSEVARATYRDPGHVWDEKKWNLACVEEGAL